MENTKSRVQYILMELAHHLPYSIFGVISAIILMAVLTFIAEAAGANNISGASNELFHVFHPSHILFSAIATTAVFWKHDNHSWIKAVFIGLFGSLSICGISDIVIPFIGGKLLGFHMGFHVCLVEEPGLIYPFAFVGIAAGLMVTQTFEHSTQYSHGVHVFLSSAASLLYLLSYGVTGWMHHITPVFLITIFAVMIPCCLSDIVFPLMCTHRYCSHNPPPPRERF